MAIVDISWPLEQGRTTEYKNRTSFLLDRYKDFEPNAMRQSKVCMDTHTGTHVDSPAHFIEGGKTIDQLPLETLQGPCVILDYTHVDEQITRKDLEQGDIPSGTIILLKTKNSFLPADGPFFEEFVYLDESGAIYLASLGVKAVGIDYLSIERDHPHHPTHLRLLEQEIPIIEGLRLAEVQPGQYTFVCLPLFLVGAEASPARALLYAP